MQQRRTDSNHDFENVSELTSSPPPYEEAVQQNSQIPRRPVHPMSLPSQSYSSAQPHGRDTSENTVSTVFLRSSRGMQDFRSYMCVIKLTEGRERRPSPAILLLGATGAGKSSFIASATGLPIGIGHTLQSYTCEPRGLKTPRSDGTSITLIDTPGFNDTKRPDTELFATIISFIQQEKYQIISVIYIQAITERKLSGSTFKILRVLRALCGEQFFQNITLVTSMWTRAPADEMEEQVVREEQFNSSLQFWADILEKGARYCRWDDTKSLPTAKNAREIVQLCENADGAPTLALFLEMENGVKLEDTTAYKVLTEQARKRQQQQEQAAMQREEGEVSQLRAQKARLEAIASVENEDYKRELRELRQLEGEQGRAASSATGHAACGWRDIFSALPRTSYVARRRSESAYLDPGSRDQSTRDASSRDRNWERDSRSSGERRYESGTERHRLRRSQHSDYEFALIKRKGK